MPRTCLACGKTGHRLDSCKSKAAVEIRRLRSILEKTRHKVGARNNPGRKNRKSGYTKEKARKAYAKKNVRKTYCEKHKKKDSRATWSGFRQNLKKQNGNHLLAYETLLQHGFLHRPTLYLACGCKSLGPPVETDKSKVVTVYVQCGMRKCSTKNQSSILPAFMIRRRRKTKQQRREVIPKPCNMSNVYIYICIILCLEV